MSERAFLVVLTLLALAIVIFMLWTQPSGWPRIGYSSGVLVI